MRDEVVSVKELTDQGKWVTETVYKDDRGVQYTVWSDQYGEEWYRDIYKDLSD
jgi:hypothetical protein